MSKESFKEYIKKNTSLASKVLNGKTTWQALYELYDIYGENPEVWDNIDKELDKKSSLKDIFNMVANLDVERVENSISSLQKAIGLLQDIGKPTSPPGKEAKPLYTYFED